MSLLNEVAAGGQTWAHRMRMLRQVVKIVLISSFVSSVLVFTFQCAKTLPPLYYRSIWYSSKASLSLFLKEPVEVPPRFWKKISTSPYRKELEAKKVIEAVQKTLDQGNQTIKKNLYISLMAYLIFSILFVLFFLVRGKQTKKRTLLSGIGEVSDLQLATKLAIQGKASSIKVGKIPLLKQKVMDHILISGVTGSGKSNCLKQVLKQIRERGERAVVVDTTGSFVSVFYREGQDLLMNPYDRRSVEWSPWCECSKDYHYEQLVNSLIPNMQYYDNFFPEAARAVLYSALRKSAELGDTDIREFVSSLLRKSVGELYEELRDTDAAVYVDPKGDKTTVSVRATISNSIRHFRSLKKLKKSIFYS